MKCHRLSTDIYSHSSGGDKSMMKVSSEGLLLGSWVAVFSLYFHMEKGQGSSLGPLFIRTLSFSWRLHLHDPVTSQRPRLLIPPHWRLGFKHRSFAGIQTMAVYTHTHTRICLLKKSSHSLEINEVCYNTFPLYLLLTVWG